MNKGVPRLSAIQVQVPVQVPIRSRRALGTRTPIRKAPSWRAPAAPPPYPSFPFKPRLCNEGPRPRGAAPWLRGEPPVRHNLGT